MIVPMKKVLLAVRTIDHEELLRILRDIGVMQIEPAEPSLLLSFPSSPELDAKILKNTPAVPGFPRETAFGICKEEVTRIERAVLILSEFCGSKRRKELDDSPELLVQKILDAHASLLVIEAAKREIEKEVPAARPWGRIDRSALSALESEGVHIGLFTCPKGVEKDIDAEVVQVICENDGRVFVAAGSRKALKVGSEVSPVALPSRDSRELEEDSARLQSEGDRLRDELLAMAESRGKIEKFLRERREQRRFLEIQGFLLRDGSVNFLQGWFPGDQSETLFQRLEAAKIPLALDVREPLDEENPPTKLSNSWWCRPIECLYDGLGITPGYREADISPIFFPFLLIFTAMLIADAGYSLIVLVPLIGGYRHLTARGIPARALDLGIVLFSGVFVYGVMTATYFGAQPAFAKRFMLINPADEDFIKWLCFLIGAVHLTIAHFWKIRRAPTSLVTLSEVGWLIFIWAMFDLVNVLVLNRPAPWRMVPMFEVSLGLVTFFTAPSWNPFSMIGQGLGSIALNAAAFLSDIISYIRLYAVGMAGGLLASTFNDMAMGMPVVLMVFVLIGAHLMNLALGLVAVLAHGVRLNLLEFSNHLGMEWAGRVFDPFRKEGEK
ncbi:MAG: hypothetical protein WA705_10535 [Candidatus Ozemobacteraceae bacterium]